MLCGKPLHKDTMGYFCKKHQRYISNRKINKALGLLKLSKSTDSEEEAKLAWNTSVRLFDEIYSNRKRGWDYEEENLFIFYSDGDRGNVIPLPICR